MVDWSSSMRKSIEVDPDGDGACVIVWVMDKCIYEFKKLYLKQNHQKTKTKRDYKQKNKKTRHCLLPWKRKMRRTRKERGGNNALFFISTIFTN
jgi:membrane protein involved in colicin uptake